MGRKKSKKSLKAMKIKQQARIRENKKNLEESYSQYKKDVDKMTIRACSLFTIAIIISATAVHLLTKGNEDSVRVSAPQLNTETPTNSVETATLK
jgi:hypothetical protein